MSANIRIIHDNAGDDATLSADAEVATLPVTHLQDPTRARVWQTPDGTTAATISGDLPELTVLSALALWRHNFSSQATWRLRVWDGAGQSGTQLYDSGTVDALPPVALGDMEWGVTPLGASAFAGWALAYSVLWFAPVTGRSFQLDLDDPGSSDGYLEASRLFLGRYLQPSVNLSWGHGLLWDEDTRQERTDGGTLRSEAGIVYRRLTIALEALQGQDRSKFQDLQRTVGLRRDLFVSVYPERGGTLERDYGFAAKIETPDPMKRPNPAYYRTGLTLVEA